MARIARLENVRAIEDTIQTAMSHQERIRILEHQQIEEEIQARARAQRYEYEARVQDEMIANMELKANQKLLDQLRQKQQDEDIK